MTLAKKFKLFRGERKMSLADVGNRAKLERTTVWKIENGFLPKGSTLQKACLRGLGLQKNSPEWQELQALWTAERTGQPVTAQALAGHIAANQRVNDQEMAKFYLAVSKLPPQSWIELQKAIRRPAVLQGLATLNALYEAAQAKGRSNLERRKSG